MRQMGIKLYCTNLPIKKQPGIPAWLLFTLPAEPCCVSSDIKGVPPYWCVRPGMFKPRRPQRLDGAGM